MVPNINNKDEWEGYWLSASDCHFKAGDIIILNVQGYSKFSGVYKIVKDWDSSVCNNTSLEMLASDGSWLPDHSWDMTDEKTTVKFWLGSSFGALPKINPMPAETYSICHWQAWAHNAPGDCPCGIVRSDCSYHR
jgi:hypothetical protein